VRRVLNREAIDSFKRATIIERDGSACQDCGKRAPDVILHIAHMISVADCKTLGFDSDDYNDEFNLFVACEECNLAYGGRSIAPQHMARLILRANRHRRGRQQP
jgi:5-methylcytosine-specific restriction endonuclease McrA